ncbi:MAG: biotin--[acetyl-CoA-carboxylase] ligase [Peptococcaceae bacterium]|jgi:BirA family biotin operon repressor/biotin-[acetyl-CoA-carboxylase] ligase|nr:biotin--[acetyl-CoA-carboxylase] ligase [Peptococcaceae bacterium]
MLLRETILQSLKAQKNAWVSGATLSHELNVSRTTVWKQMQQLLAAGYAIEASTKKGYRLTSEVDRLSPEEVRSGLASAEFGRWNYFYYPETDSTNARARDLAAQGYPEGTVVVAERQTAGRGRRGRRWYSPANKGIYLSIILRPKLPLKDIARISLVAAVAVAETLETELQLPARIKWPNDLFIGHKKIAGILAEAATDMDSIEYIVVGIGLNFNHTLQDFPDELQSCATSVLLEDPAQRRRVNCLQNLLLQLEEHYAQLLNGDFNRILVKARRLSMVIAKEVQFDSLNSTIAGKAIDIDDNGFLLVRDPSGVIHSMMSGEITRIS